MLRGVPFERQKPVPLVYKDLKLECGYRLDFPFAERVVLEIKSIDAIAPIHESVMLTYLRLSGRSLGLLINFNVPVLKDGIRRYVWHYTAEKDNAETLRPAEPNGEAATSF
jgi:GxxExxY protein